MAKRTQPDLNALFRPTESPAREEAEAPAPGPGQQGAERSAPAAADVDRTLPVGVGLKGSEVGQLDDIARELGIARNALMRFALRYFIAQYRAGAVTVPVEREEKRRVRMP